MRASASISQCASYSLYSILFSETEYIRHLARIVYRWGKHLPGHHRPERVCLLRFKHRREQQWQLLWAERPRRYGRRGGG